MRREGRRKSKHRGGRGRGSGRKKAEGVSETARCCSHHIATSSHGLVQPCSTEKETEATWVETGPAGLGFAPGYPDECGFSYDAKCPLSPCGPHAKVTAESFP